MKELFVQYAAYHAWANSSLLSLIESLPQEQHKAPLPGSFPGLYQTVLHTLDAESIWWQRIKLQEQVVRPSDTFSGDFSTLAATLRKQNQQWVAYVGGLTEHGLQHEFIYRNLKKERFKQPVYETLLHLFNHGTYHRGQLVTMLRQLRVEKIPATDFIEWRRRK